MKTITIDLENKKVNEIMDKMIRNNDINNIVHYQNTTRKLVYDVDGFVPWRQVYHNGMNYDDLNKLFTALASIVTSLNNIMIGEENIDFGLDKIFIDKDGSIRLAIVPILYKGGNRDVKHLFREIMNSCTYKIDGREVDLIMINNYFNGSNYSVDGLVQRFFIKNEKMGCLPVVKYNELALDCNNEKNNNKMLDEETERLYNDKAVLKKKISIIERLSTLLFKKEYRIKSLDIDFKLPKK